MEAKNVPRERCPSCRAPIVATKPTDLFALNASSLHFLYAETVVKMGMSDGGKSGGKDEEVDIALIANLLPKILLERGNILL